MTLSPAALRHGNDFLLLLGLGLAYLLQDTHKVSQLNRLMIYRKTLE